MREDKESEESEEESEGREEISMPKEGHKICRPRKGRCLEPIKNTQAILLFRSANLAEVHAPWARRPLPLGPLDPRACRN